MLYTLLTNAAVSLLVGLTLLWLWQAHEAQVFVRDIGLAYLLQIAMPIGLALADPEVGDSRTAGHALVMFGAIAYQTLLLSGFTRLAGRQPRLRYLAALAGVLAVVNGYGAVSGDLQGAQGVHAAISVAIALLVLGWLRGHGAPEQAVGLLLLLMGVNQVVYPLGGQEFVPVQASIATVLRLALGVALLIAALQRSAATSRHAKERFEGLVARSPQGMVVRNADGILYSNPVLRSLYGFTPDEEVTVDAMDAAIPQPERAGVAERYARLGSGQVGEASWEGPRVRRDGSELWLRFLAWRTEWDGAPAVQIMVTDQTAQRDIAQALLHQALHDRLTGLPNRSALQERLTAASAGNPSVAPFGLLLLDIDRFKLFNEAHGHSLGDEVLKALGAALVRELGDAAEVMRLGEDEFAVLLEGIGDEPALRGVAARVQQLLTSPLVLSQHEFFIDVSMGLALCPLHACNGEALLRAANAAMHVAKRTPGTSLAVAEDGFERGSVDLLGQEQALRAGIQNREFFLSYQPKVNAATRRLTGFEALARWDQPGRGRVPPVEFIAAAERTGLIGPLGALLLQQACAQIAQWRAAYGECVPVAVNVSPLQMLDGGFVALLRQTLDASGVPPRALTLEITESAAVADMAQARAQIAQLRALGVEVALDDFGTGFSSLNMLRSLPLHTVKIDRGLIDPLPAPDAAAVVHAVCQLAHALGLQVVAEGVERAEHADAAALSGCQELQGYLFAVPLNAAQAAQWLETGREPPGTQAVNMESVAIAGSAAQPVPGAAARATAHVSVP